LFNRPALYNLLGRFYAGTVKTDQAEEAFLKAVQTAPDSMPTRLFLAEFYEAGGRLAEALAVYREALAKDPEEGRVKQALDRDAIKLEALANLTLVYSRKAKQTPSSAPYKTEAAASGALHHGFLETKVRKNIA